MNSCSAANRKTRAIDADERERFDGEILPELRTAGVWRGEAIGLTADGVTFPQELTLRHLEDGAIVCVVRDTDRTASGRR